MIQYSVLLFSLFLNFSCSTKVKSVTSNKGEKTNHIVSKISPVEDTICNEEALYKEKNDNVSVDDSVKDKDATATSSEDEEEEDSNITHSSRKKSVSNYCNPVSVSDAIHNNDLIALKSLLDAGSDPNRSTSAFSPIDQSIRENNIAAVHLLLKAGADPLFKDLGESAIDWTIRNSKEILEILLIHIALRGQKDEKGLNPLHWASKDGHTSVVRALIDSDQALNYNECEPSYNFTPLHWAARRGHSEIVELLLNKGADRTAVSKHGFTPLMLALSNEHNDLIDLLSPDGFNRHAMTPVAVKEEEIEEDKEECPICMEELVASDNNNPIIALPCSVKVQHRFHKTCMALWRVGIDDQICPVCRRRTATFAINVSSKVQPTHTLFTASISNDAQSIKQLLSQSHDINAIHPYSGNTALIESINRHHKEAFDTLLQYGADPNIPNKYGNYPINCLVMYSSTLDYVFVNHALVELIKRGAHVNGKDAPSAAGFFLCSSRYKAILYEAGNLENYPKLPKGSFGVRINYKGFNNE